ncbi:Chain A Histidyl-Trna Synthetase (Apo) [Perkinsela sp. CCAP 1560/4]|nr:Chain A Histidyl-Trna Synthetase (Apo) [Perkinsela sp. CCAP 1560/4]|eukprot:KNH07747.1 Chain A Histidyl-Trna Synthetase (Apo) [Perkinsela sp. CCAP 1560/4]
MLNFRCPEWTGIACQTCPWKAIVNVFADRLHFLQTSLQRVLMLPFKRQATTPHTPKSDKKSSTTSISIDPVQGTRDFPPDEMRVRNYLFDAFRSTAKSFCFEEYDAPVVEHEALYVRKGGDEITKQMYSFTTRHGHKLCLRPEMTPSLARLVLGKGKALSLPVKWFSIPQCWRYEDITRGRRREHYQWNMDILGVKGVAAEAELIAAVCTALQKLDLSEKEIVVKVSSRKILQHLLVLSGVQSDDFAKVCIVIDKFDKYPREEIWTMLDELGVSDYAIENIFRAMLVTNLDQMESLLQAVQSGADNPDTTTADISSALQEVKDLFGMLRAYGMADWVEFDASIVRGLTYYTGVVFEVVDRERKFRAICGGGRYDGLFATYGSNLAIPACGFGFGDCVIHEILREKKRLPALQRTIDDVVIPFDESMRPAAIEVVALLRSKGRTADIIMHTKKVGQSFAYADKNGAERAVFVAPDEWAAESVRVKYLRKTEADVESKGPSKDKGESMKICDL